MKSQRYDLNKSKTEASFNLNTNPHPPPPSPLLPPTLHFPAMEARRAQEAVLDGVEACPPGHATDRGAGRRRRAGCTSGAVLGRVHWGALGGGEWAPPGGGVGGYLCDGDRFAVVVRVEVVAAEGRHWRNRGEGDGEFGGDGEGRVASHPGAVGNGGSQRLDGCVGLRFGSGGALCSVGERVGPGGLQGLLRHLGLGGEGLRAGVHEGRPHLWLEGFGCVGPHPIKTNLRGVGGAAVGRLT